MAAVVKTLVEATLLKPVVAMDSPYEVLGNPQIIVPNADAIPSPNRVLLSPGLFIKSVPITLDNTLWSLMCSSIAQIVTGIKIKATLIIKDGLILFSHFKNVNSGKLNNVIPLNILKSIRSTTPNEVKITHNI